MEKAYY